MLKYILFDLDGTIADTSEGILNGYLYCMPRIGLPVPADKNELRPMIGPPLSRVLQERYGVSREVGEEGFRLFREYLGLRGTKECEVYPGMPALLRELREHDLRVMIATSKSTVYARATLEHLGLLDAFEFLGCADPVTGRREKEDVIAYVREHFPDICAENTVMVGDRVYDVIGARLNGLPVIWCSFGLAQPGEMGDEIPDYTARTVAELREILISKLN